jgi:hypothetical protein
MALVTLMVSPVSRKTVTPVVLLCEENTLPSEA